MPKIENHSNTNPMNKGTKALLACTLIVALKGLLFSAQPNVIFVMAEKEHQPHSSAKLSSTPALKKTATSPFTKAPTN